MPGGRLIGVQTNVHRSDAHSWAMVSRAPDPRLKPYIIDYMGYREQAAGPMRRLQPPFDGIPMIVTFGPAIDIINGDRPAQRGAFRSFLAGLHDVHVFTEYQGAQMGFQVNFTLLGAYRFLNITMSDIANRVLDLGDLLGDAGRIVSRIRCGTPRIGRRASTWWIASCWNACARAGRCRPISPGR